MAVLEHFRLLSEQRFLEIYEALSQQGYGPLDGEVAKLLKFRPQAIKKVPLAKRAKLAKNWIEQKHNAELCYELFGTYLVRTKKELVTGFLDATGVPHEDGMIEDIGRAQPDPAKIPAAVKELEDKFGADDVTLYLALCTEQWPGVPELAALWKQRSGAA
ncbi:MAG: hypothetical protein HOP15_16010 [Planctomycetes bacterium]|nr:hypothetical protein [Planctomycetota bacterium]